MSFEYTDIPHKAILSISIHTFIPISATSCLSLYPLYLTLKGMPSGPRDRCFIRGWTVFGTGYHKGKLYDLEDCLNIGRNFQRLSTAWKGQQPLVKPKLTIGHDEEERLQQSAGFPSLGVVTKQHTEPNGLIVLDEIAEIPAQIGALINGGFYNDGSIVLAPPLPNPDDQSKLMYPVMTAISLLGEEQPAVPVRYPIPRAVFADGTEVPPETDMTKLAQAMAEVSRNFAAGAKTRRRTLDYMGRTYALASGLCFSQMTPHFGDVSMDRMAIIAALKQAGIPADTDPELQGKSDQELQQLLDDQKASGFSCKTPEAFAAAKKMFGMMKPKAAAVEPTTPANHAAGDVTNPTTPADPRAARCRCRSNSPTR